MNPLLAAAGCWLVVAADHDLITSNLQTGTRQTGGSQYRAQKAANTEHRRQPIQSTGGMHTSRDKQTINKSYNAMSTRVSAVATIGPGWRGAALLPVRELALLGFRPTLDWLNFGFFQQ